jgi:hypothetical protein
MDQQMQMQGIDSNNPDGGTDQQPLANDEDTDVTPATDEKTRKMQKAKASYNLLSKKKNRSLKDEADFKSVTQILAKNK